MMKTVNILKLLKMLMMAGMVVLMLTACNGNDQDNKEQAPIQSDISGNDPTECWQAEVVKPLYELMGTVALSTYRKMTGGAMSLMMIAFALWLSKRLVSQLGSLKEETLGEVWTEIAKMFFMCFVCGLIASRVDLLAIFLGDFIFPIYNAFLEFAEQILKSATPDTAKLSGSIPIWGREFSVTTSQHPIVCNVISTVQLTADSTGFPDSPRQMMECLICSINHSLSFGIQVAMDAMTKSSITSWIVGLFVMICFVFVKLGFTFYLVDTIFRFTVMVVMLPIMIMCFPFPKTKGILGKGIKNMVNSAAFMMFFAVIITMCIQALALIIKSFQTTFSGDEPFADFSVPFVCMMMIGFLVISSVKIAGKLCDRIVGGKSNSAFQKDAKALIVGAAKWIVSLGAQMASFFVPKNVKEGFKNTIGKAAGYLKGGGDK